MAYLPLILILFLVSCSSVDKKTDTDTTAAKNVTAPKPPPCNKSRDLEAQCTYTMLLNDQKTPEKMFAGKEKELEPVVQYLQEFSKARISIEGHTYKHKSAGESLKIGEKIADYAKKYLISKGISEKNLETISYGQERLSDDKAKKLSSLRVVFVFIPDDSPVCENKPGEPAQCPIY